MLFSKEIKDSFNDINSKYDLAAYCYYYLMNVIDNQNIFLGDYIKINPDAESVNPNFRMLNCFAMQIKNVLEQNPFKAFLSDIHSNEILAKVTLTEKNLLDFGDRLMNQATVPFYILKGIDLYFKDCAYKTYKTAPLNEYCKEFCLIYVNSESSCMDKIMIEKNYPDIIHTNEIRNYFKHIIILEINELPKGYGQPRLVTLHKEKEDLEKIIETNRMKIALIPVMRKQWFEFDIKRGASFEIEYDDKQIANVKERVAVLLKQAIARKGQGSPISVG